jgi:hypothetical protein
VRLSTGAQPQQGRGQAAPRVHRQRGALLPQPVGIHHQQARQRAVAFRGMLQCGLDQAVAKKEIIDAAQAGGDIGRPVIGVVVIKVLAGFDHGAAVGLA